MTSSGWSVTADRSWCPRHQVGRVSAFGSPLCYYGGLPALRRRGLWEALALAAAALIAAFSYLMVQCLELTSCLVGVCVEIKLQAPHAIGTMLSLSDHCVSLTG